MASLAVLAVLSSLVVPTIANILNANQSRSIAQLFQDNLRQARYASRINTNQAIVFCALGNVNKSLCQLSGQGEVEGPVLRNQFTHGWQWFIDSNPNKQFNIDSDTLLGNTIRVVDQGVNIEIRSPQTIIAQNVITFTNGRISIVSPTGDPITPSITFNKNNGKQSALIFNLTGRTRLVHGTQDESNPNSESS